MYARWYVLRGQLFNFMCMCTTAYVWQLDVFMVFVTLSPCGFGVKLRWVVKDVGHVPVSPNCS